MVQDMSTKNEDQELDTLKAKLARERALGDRFRANELKALAERDAANEKVERLSRVLEEALKQQAHAEAQQRKAERRYEKLRQSVRRVLSVVRDTDKATP